MTVIERRVVEQDWYETEYNKTGWDSYGWIFKEDRHPIDDTEWIVEIVHVDKYSNPILGIAEREVEI